MAKHTVESFKGKAVQKLSPVDRIADTLTSSFGTIWFLIFNGAFFTVWILWNTGILGPLKIIDPFPFNFLTMIVSLEAIFLSIIVLISQNREARIAELRAEMDLYIDRYAEAEITKIIYLQTLLLEKNGIDISDDEELQAMLKNLPSKKIEKELEKQL